VITEYINKYTSSVVDSAMSAYNAEKKAIGKRASGGPTDANVPYLVGENGPEIWMSNTAGRVLNASASRGMIATAGLKGAMASTSSATSGPRAVEVRVSGDDPALVSLLKRLIRTANVLEA